MLFDMNLCVGQVDPPWVPMASLGEACAVGDVRSIAHLLDCGASVNDFIVSGYSSAPPLLHPPTTTSIPLFTLLQQVFYL